MLEAGPRVKVKALMAGPLLPPWGKERPSEHHLLTGLQIKPYRPNLIINTLNQ